MPLNKYLLITTLTSLLLGGGLLYIITQTSPLERSWQNITLFLILLFLFSFCLLMTLGFYLRLFYTNNESYYRNFSVSLRQAVEGGSLIVTLLTFQLFRVLDAMVALLLITAFLFFELYFLRPPENNLETKNNF